MSNQKKISKYISIRPCPVTPFEGCKKYISTGDSDDFSNGEVVTFQNRPSRANLQPLVDDILFAKMKKTNKVILIDEEAQELIFSTGFFAINPLLNHPRYIYFLCQSDEFNKEKDSLSFGTTQEALNERRFKQMSISFVTDHYKQQAIATYLDEQVSRLDQLIQDQQRVIEEWKAYKQSLITETVTKGLNPEVEMKDSGIEWIGEIPSHWKVKKLKFLSSIKTGNKDTQNKDDSGVYPFFVRSDNVERINSFTFDGEAVLTAGDGVGVGKVFHYINGKFDYHQRVYNFHNFRGVIGKFFYYFLKELFIKEIEKGTAKTTVDSLRLPLIKEFPISIPPLHEQQMIADFLDEKCSKIDQLIEDKQRLIEDLKTYKQSLIYECVTGKKEIV